MVHSTQSDGILENCRFKHAGKGMVDAGADVVDEPNAKIATNIDPIAHITIIARNLERAAAPNDFYRRGTAGGAIGSSHTAFGSRAIARLGRAPQSLPTGTTALKRLLMPAISQV